MTIASIKSLATKLSLATTAAGAFLFAGAAPVQAQQFTAPFQHGAPAYAVHRNFYVRQRWEREAFERRQHEEFLRRQRWEREHRY